MGGGHGTRAEVRKQVKENVETRSDPINRAPARVEENYTLRVGAAATLAAYSPPFHETTAPDAAQASARVRPCKRLFEFCGRIRRTEKFSRENALSYISPKIARFLVLLAALLRAPAAACVCAVQG